MNKELGLDGLGHKVSVLARLNFVDLQCRLAMANGHRLFESVVVFRIR